MTPDTIEVEAETVVRARMKEWAYESDGGVPRGMIDVLSTKSSPARGEMYTDDSSDRPKGIGISPSRFLEPDSNGRTPPYEEWGEMQEHCREQDQDTDECWEEIEAVEREHVQRQLAEEVQPHPRDRDDLDGVKIEYI